MYKNSPVSIVLTTGMVFGKLEITINLLADHSDAGMAHIPGALLI